MDETVHRAFAAETIPLAGEVEARLLDLERRASALGEEWRALLGALHTIKGNCGMVGQGGAEALSHAMEQRARELRDAPSHAQARAIDVLLQATDRLRAAIETPTSIAEVEREIDQLLTPRDSPVADAEYVRERESETPAGLPASASHVQIPGERLDRLLDVVADLLAWQARLRTATRPRGRRAVRDASPWLEPLDEMERRLAELRGHLAELRLVPLSTLLVRFDRLVRDLSRVTNKPIDLVVSGGELAIDKQVADHLAEPLLHIVRNAIDHGIEPARARMLADKPVAGALTIDARAERGVLVLTVKDDGRGLDPARLIAAAARVGIDARAWTTEQVLELVFAPDVSTAERVTNLSGRGVGLDQARRALERIGGSIQVASAPGVGTEFRLRVPMVIAVQRSLLVRCGAEVYGIPFTSVVEAFRLPGGEPSAAVPWRGAELATCSLAREIGLEDRAAGPATCVVIDGAGAPLGVIVDAVLGHEDLTIRELDPVFGRPRSVTGASLLADGRIVPVLDLQGIGRSARAASVGGAW
ncbi:MAG: chemotaxis protein CheW [Deltaproteobacteria bacterium]|nr:chemotaxis protein CheW [Deltaproteobacteria bacterium]